MKKIRYSKDVDALLIELIDKPIAYAEDEGQMILHYSDTDQLVLIEILDVQQFISTGQQLAEMANDPAIQAELTAINQEFAVTKMDGLGQL